MAIYTIKIEGQEIPIPEQIGTDDAAVKRALAPFYPDAANALITRTTSEDGSRVDVNVVKKAGTKGASLDGLYGAAYLDACSEGQNPAIAMYQRLAALQGEADIEALLALDGEIEQAIEDGRKQAEMLQPAMKRLDAARPQAAPAVILGF